MDKISAMSIFFFLIRLKSLFLVRLKLLNFQKLCEKVNGMLISSGYLCFLVPGLGLAPRPSIYIYRSWPSICIFQPWPQICIYGPWASICFYQPWYSICVCLFFNLQLKCVIVTLFIYIKSWYKYLLLRQNVENK